MTSTFAVGAAWLQTTDFSSTGGHWLLVFVGIIAACWVILILALIAVAIGGLIAWRKVEALLNEAKTKAFPIIGDVQAIVTDVKPKVISITESVRHVMGNVAETSDDLKTKTKDIASKVTTTVDDASNRTRTQVDRVDGMFNSALNATSDVAAKIHYGIRYPIVEISGIVNGLKAGLETLFSGGSHSSTPTSTGAAKAGPSAVQSTAGEGSLTPERGFGQDRFSAARANAQSESGSAAMGIDDRPGTDAPGVETVSADPTLKGEVESDPSSAVAPSPGAQKVVDRYFTGTSRSDSNRKP